MIPSSNGVIYSRKHQKQPLIQRDWQNKNEYVFLHHQNGEKQSQLVAV